MNAQIIVQIPRTLVDKTIQETMTDEQVMFSRGFEAKSEIPPCRLIELVDMPQYYTVLYSNPRIERLKNLIFLRRHVGHCL
jgi:hypothetical protein